MGFVLESVFKSQSPWAVAGMSFAMLVLGSNEVTFTRSKRRPQGLVRLHPPRLRLPHSY